MRKYLSKTDENGFYYILLLVFLSTYINGCARMSKPMMQASIELFQLGVHRDLINGPCRPFASHHTVDELVQGHFPVPVVQEVEQSRALRSKSSFSPKRGPRIVLDPRKHPAGSETERGGAPLFARYPRHKS